MPRKLKGKVTPLPADDKKAAKASLRELRRRMRSMGLPVPGGGLPINRYLNHQPTPKPPESIAEHNEDSRGKAAAGPTEHSRMPRTRPDAPPPSHEVGGRGCFLSQQIVVVVPSGLCADPCENPFPKTDPRHQLWEDATREAEKDIAKLRAELLMEPCVSFMEQVRSNMIEAVTAFDIWTHRTLAAVVSDADISGYDRWLLSYATNMIECAKAPHNSELRRVIAERIEVRKAEARERVAQIAATITQAATAAEANLPTESAPDTNLNGATGSKPPKADPATAAVRQAWMDQRHPGWSLPQWRGHTKIAYETLRKYREGVTTNRTRSVRADIACSEGVDFSTVPE